MDVVTKLEIEIEYIKKGMDEMKDTLIKLIEKLDSFNTVERDIALIKSEDVHCRMINSQKFISLETRVTKLEDQPDKNFSKRYMIMAMIGIGASILTSVGALILSIWRK